MKCKLLKVLITAAVTVCMMFSLAACGGKTETSDLWSVQRAYATAQELGFEGTLEEFVAMLKGADGKDGKDGAPGAAGKDGANGKDGKDGATGADGIGIKSAVIDVRGHLIITLTDGREIDAGVVGVSETPQSYSYDLAYQEIKTEAGEKAYAVRGLGMEFNCDIVIPAVFNGCPVIAIGEFSLTTSRLLRSVVIPDSVTTIGRSAFYDCDILESVTIGKGVTFIDRSAFADCPALTSITYSGTKAEWEKIEKNAWWKDGSPITSIVCTDGTIVL